MLSMTNTIPIVKSPIQMFSKIANLQASPQKTEMCHFRDPLVCKLAIFENTCQWLACPRQVQKWLTLFYNTPPKKSVHRLLLLFLLLLSSNEMQSSIPSVNITSTIGRQFY